MPTLTRIVVAGAVGGVISIFTSWVFMGALFHSYQKLTPETWRPEGPAQYGMSSAVQVLAGAAVGLLFYSTGQASHVATAGWLQSGLSFGALAWLAVAAPTQLINAVYVKLDRGVVVGSLLDSFVGLVVVSCACAWVAQ